jgi:hypothetical protein
MKYFFSLLAVLIAVNYSFAQTNTFPSNGNVGIGTTSPTAGILQVNGSEDLLTLYSNTGVAQFNAYNNSDFRIIQRSNAVMSFWTNTVERMRIDATGNMGIGTVGPTEKLTVRDQNIAYDSSSGIVKLLFDSGNGGGGVGFEKETFNTGGLRFFTQYGWGSTLEKMRITANGNVGVGTTNPDAKLTVNGTIHSKEVKVDLSMPAPDYVFAPDYTLIKLSELKTYIDLNRHLPEIPSAAQMAKEGLSLGDMNTKLLKKVEELTLYLIEQQKELTALKASQQELRDLVLKNKPKL